MKKTGFTLAAALLLLAPALAAQDTPGIIFGMYLRCDQGMESRADQVVAEVWAPVIQSQIDAGRVAGWVWLAHEQGAEWRRLLATVGTDMGAMMEARDEMSARLTQDEDASGLWEACPGHDDYIWIATAQSTTDVDAVGGATISAYHMCDRAREARADEIFGDILAPLYQKHIDMGHMASYGFYAHRMGGLHRRLETISGADHMTLMNMQGAVYTEAFETNPLAMQEFSEICHAHSDYMWTNQTPGN